MQTLHQDSPAYLHHMRVLSSKPEDLARFYERMLDMQKNRVTETGDVVMIGPARALLISPLDGHNEPYFAYSVTSDDALASLKERLASSDVPVKRLHDPLFHGQSLMFADPQGRRFVFGVAERPSGEGAPGRLQHTVFQTTELASVVSFFVEKVGFLISDEVVDSEGAPTVVFLRSDDEHHTLAFFRGSRNEWDHHCYETNEWNDIRDWGDRFAKAEIPIFFGPGRHGPGNNLFFMVTDPDGNRLEFSAELDRVAPDAPPGVWPQGERTLNSWGSAWIRT